MFDWHRLRLDSGFPNNTWVRPPTLADPNEYGLALATIIQLDSDPTQTFDNEVFGFLVEETEVNCPSHAMESLIFLSRLFVKLDDIWPTATYWIV